MQIAKSPARRVIFTVMCQLHLWRVHRLFCRPDADPEHPPLPGPVAGTGDPDHGHAGLPPHRGKDGRPVPKILLSLMRMVPSQGITARSDRAAVTFGKGLPEDELAYLHALIRKTLTD